MIETGLWLDEAIQEAMEEAERRLSDDFSTQKLKKYQQDPIGFAEDYFDDYLTDDMKEVMLSVRDNAVTIAKSGNSTGKTYGSAKIALWFYAVYPNSKVFLTAAPPLDNLKRLLWGEIQHAIRKRPALFESHKQRSLYIQRHPQSFIQCLTIPQTGTDSERESKFCADADELFEMRDGSVVKYNDLIDRTDVPVISVDEKFRKNNSLAEFFDNGIKEVFEITLEDGQVLRRTGNHPLYAAWDIRIDYRTHGGTHVNGRIRPWKRGWLHVSELSKDHAILCPRSTEFNFGNKITDENMLKVLAYLIGDGCLVSKSPGTSSVQFTQVDNPQSEEYIELMDKLGYCYNISDKEKYSWKIVCSYDNELTEYLRKCGIYGKRSGEKFVPEFVNGLSKEQVALFLNRLFSTDGWACMTRAGKYKKAEIGYGSKSERLIRDIQRLLNRFGIQSRAKSKMVKWEANGERRKGKHWALYINTACDIKRFAKEIGIFGKEDSVQECLEYAENRKWVHAGWKYKMPGYRWVKVKSVKPIGKRETVGITVPGNNTYLTSAVEHNSGKHSSHMLFIVDEGDAVPDAVYRGIESCMSGGHTRLLVMFNPRQKAGVVYRKEKNQQANIVRMSALDHPNVITGKDVISGAVDRQTTVKRINEWTRPLKEKEDPEKMDSFTVPDFLIGVTAVADDGKEYPPLPAGERKIINPAFSYMVLGLYPAQSESQLIDGEMIEQAQQRWKLYVTKHGEEQDGQPKMGLDVAEMGNDYNIACFRYAGFVEKFYHYWNGIDSDATATRALGLYKQKNVEMAYIDGTSWGSSVAPSMSRQGRSDGVRAVSVKLAESPEDFLKVEMGEFYQLRDQLYWAIREWLHKDNTAMLPPDPELEEELRALEYTVDGRGRIKVTNKDNLRKMLKRSPDKVDALALTFAPYERAKVISLDL